MGTHSPEKNQRVIVNRCPNFSLAGVQTNVWQGEKKQAGVQTNVWQDWSPNFSLARRIVRSPIPPESKIYLRRLFCLESKIYLGRLFIHDF